MTDFLASIGVAPQRCLDEALGPRSDSNPIPKCALKDLSVFSVQYDDCSRPWVMCRCADAEMSEATMVAEFGRLPPRLRSWVRHIIAFSGEDENGNVGTGAGSSDDIIVFYGTAGTPTIFIHEAAHSIDQGFSGEQDWEDTYESDTCIPDNYATSSPAENFAQVTVTVMAMKNTGSTGGFDPMSCMANQFNSVWDTFGSQLTVEGDQECDLGVRREDSPTVAWVYRGTKAKRDVYTNPAIEWFNVEH